MNSKRNSYLSALLMILFFVSFSYSQTTASKTENKSKLFEQAIDILINRWDKSRGIKRESLVSSDINIQVLLEFYQKLADAKRHQQTAQP